MCIVDDERQNYLSKPLPEDGNTYQTHTSCQVTVKSISLYCDWSQYDARLVNPNVDSDGDGDVDLTESGRGYDLQHDD
ncbi:hypothetical protein O9992_12965 [Vibrio lentus]|nr:hypothetical protein [Vibrio lentus]